MLPDTEQSPIPTFHLGAKKDTGWHCSKRVRKHTQFVLIKAMGLGVKTKFNPSFLSLRFSQTVLTSDSVHLASVPGVLRASAAFQNTGLFNLIIDGSAVTCRSTQPENSLQPQQNAQAAALLCCVLTTS